MRLRFFLLMVLLLTLLEIVSATCSEEQININSASLEELDTLYGIGPAKAQEIINSRPFSSVDDLIKVKGIGEVTLNNIKTQGLACVEDEEEIEDKDNGSIDSSINNETEIVADNNTFIEEPMINNLSSKQETEPQTIDLNPKAIKTAGPKSLKKNYAVLGLLVFCVLLAVLFVLKRKKYKNEFK